MDYQRAQKFGMEPDIVGLVPSLKELSLAELKEIPFSVLNELLKTNFPAGSDESTHELLYEAIQRTVMDPKMQKPLELILRSDGLWIRVCGEEKAPLYGEAMSLAAKFFLSEDRITHSLCPDCEQKERERYKKAREERITSENLAIQKSVSTTLSENSTVELEE